MFIFFCYHMKTVLYIIIAHLEGSLHLVNYNNNEETPDLIKLSILTLSLFKLVWAEYNRKDPILLIYFVMLSPLHT